MDAAFTQEQVEMRRTLRAALTTHRGPDQVKAATRGHLGYDGVLWRRLARELGLPGLTVAREHGGAGCGPVELALACEELGRALLPSPFLAGTVLAAPLLTALGTPVQRTALLPRLAAGELTATLVVPGRVLSAVLGLTGPCPAEWAGGGRAGGIQARRTPDGWRLYGEADQVLDGHSAELLLVAARSGGYTRGRTLLFLVPASAPGLVRTRHTALDETRPQGRVELRDTPAELLGAYTGTDRGAAGLAVGASGAAERGAPRGVSAGVPEASEQDVAPVLAGLAAPLGVALAAEAVGAAEQALARTVGHVRTRKQFGRVIGSFQAVRHRLADLYVELAAARSAVYYAAWAGGATASGLALAQAGQALRAVAGQAIQLHGGIGFTWEHDAHLFFKRAASDELLFGPGHRLRGWAAERAGLFVPTEDPLGVVAV
ncbi:acyl-CoA dehydrogenase family protein [Streptomyces palmae]|uniref:Acyl-CoA dehydrogenase n=1 Tax=Streptomyces palmae TaxID=1701085 RepID=A0A4Z0FTZ5_9ACTN|nr:acyl-CoA dehydrogenase family protein [Streptomyces palmae]TGA85475.1 acyl-CoA dehydrogenase [Streptomyces palmae]